jgi:multidrug efflux pump subunit AcrA (membrane-fusion protein)
VNFTAEATTGSEAKPSVQVPKSSLVTRGGRSGVFLIEENHARFRPVTTGREQEGIVEVQKGLLGGESLVADASKLDLSDGQRVRIKE